MAELRYATQVNDHNQHGGTNGFPSSIVASMIQVAGAGFRLSLLLNAVATEMAHADHDIRNVAKDVSLFSLMLKQVGKTIEGGKTIASQSAVDTATEIKEQSEKVFEEIKGMVDFTQGRDEKGHVRSITRVERLKYSFKKQKVQYLLGQLESLKLSLSIMLQILQMGQTIATTRYVIVRLYHVYCYSDSYLQGRSIKTSSERQSVITREGRNSEYDGCTTLVPCGASQALRIG